MLILVLSEINQALLRRLNDEMDRTRLDFFETQRQIDRIVFELKAELPSPDRGQRIINAGRASRSAFRQYERAIKRLTDYLDHGIIPDDA